MQTKMIGSKIAETRRKLNVSQAHLAERLFISPQAVGKWERGESLPDLITLNRLAKILGVDLNYFSEDFPSVSNETIFHESPVNQSVEPIFVKQKEKLNWNMSRGNWVGADFSGLKNLHEKFSSSNMQHCLFIGSDLSGLLLKGNNINNCDFSGSGFNNSHIQSSNIARSKFKSCYLKETEFSASYISGCDFTGSDMTGIVVKSGGFEKNILTDAVLDRSSFIDTQLIDVIFEGTLKDCYFENCSFNRVKFQDARIINTFFKNKSLKRIRLINCQVDRMTYAFLKNGKADLTGIMLLEE